MMHVWSLGRTQFNISNPFIKLSSVDRQSYDTSIFFMVDLCVRYSVCVVNKCTRKHFDCAEFTATLK